MSTDITTRKYGNWICNNCGEYAYPKYYAPEESIEDMHAYENHRLDQE